MSSILVHNIPCFYNYNYILAEDFSKEVNLEIAYDYWVKETLSKLPYKSVWLNINEIKRGNELTDEIIKRSTINNINKYLDKDFSKTLYESIMKNGTYSHFYINENHELLEGIHRYYSLKKNNYQGKVLCFIMPMRIKEMYVENKNFEKISEYTSLNFDVIIPSYYEIVDFFEPSIRRKNILVDENVKLINAKDIIMGDEFTKIIGIRDYFSLITIFHTFNKWFHINAYNYKIKKEVELQGHFLINNQDFWIKERIKNGCYYKYDL